MATVDSLDVQIAASAQKANDAINGLIKNLKRLSNSLNIDTSGLEKIGKSISVDNISKSTKRQSKKIAKSASQAAREFQDKFKNISVKVDFSKPEAELQKFQRQAQTAQNALSRIMASSSADKQIKGIEKWSISLAQANNAIELLEKRLAEVKSVGANLDFTITRPDESNKYLDEYKKELADFKKDIQDISDKFGGLQNVPKGNLGTPIQNLKMSIEELKQSFPQATEVIAAFEKELQKLQGISSGLTRKPIRTNIETSSLDRVNEKITELKNKFDKIGSDFKFTGNFEQLNIEIEKVYSKLNELKAREQEMISAGQVNTSGFERLQESLAEVGNKFEIMQDLRDRTETFNQSLQKLVIPPIHQENLAKLQDALRRTEEEAEKLKAKLANLITTGKISPNIDNSTFKDLTIKIAESEKKAEALRQKIQEVGDSAGGESKVRKLDRSLSSISLHSNKASNSANLLGKSIRNLSSATNGFSKVAKRATTGMKSFARQTLSAIGAYASFYGAIKGLKSAVKSSMDYVETLNYFNAAFRQVAENADLSGWKEAGYESAEVYADSFKERAKQLTQKLTGFEVSDTGELTRTTMPSLGLDPDKTMQYQATFAQMASSMGTTSDAALKVSNALTMIGADLASVRNLDFDKVWGDMASGLAGMSRTLDKYGVNIRNVNLQQKLNSLGIDESITKINQQDKALLRTIILLENTKYAWGDLAETIDDSNVLSLVA